MPMRSEMIHHVYIADGFDDDCDLLIHRCVQTERLNYETFCEIWKDMQFDSLYVGRSSPVEIAELSEEMVHIAKQYMMSQTTNFEENVAGLFLLYGLLNLQPYPGFAVLRLVPEDVPQVKKIEDIARRDRRHDILYILGTVLVKHTQYHAEQRERGLEQVYRKYLDAEFISIDRSGYRPRGVFHRQTEELDVIRELAAVTDRYENAKRAVTGGKTDPSLSYINKSLPSELEASLKRIMSGITALPDEEKDASDVHYSKVQAIKEKAMKNAVGGVKHLTSAAGRSLTVSEPIVSEIKSQPGKIKTSSPTKTYSSPKRKGTNSCPPKSPGTNTTKSPETYTTATKSPRKITTVLKSPRKTITVLKSPRTTKKVSKSKSPKKTSLVAKASTSKPMKRKLSPKKRKSKVEISSSSDSDSDIDLGELDKDSESDYNISLSSGDEFYSNAFIKPRELSKDLVEIEIDDFRPHISTDDVKVVDPEILDKLNKLKARIASLEEDVHNSAGSTSKSKEKVNSEDENCDEDSKSIANKNGIDDLENDDYDEFFRSKANKKDTEDLEKEKSEDSDVSEDGNIQYKRPKKIRDNHFFRRLGKVGVLPVADIPKKRRVTRQMTKSEEDSY